MDRPGRVPPKVKARLTLLTCSSRPEPPACPALPTLAKPLLVGVPFEKKNSLTVMVAPESEKVAPTLYWVLRVNPSKSTQSPCGQSWSIHSSWPPTANELIVPDSLTWPLSLPRPLTTTALTPPI